MDTHHLTIITGASRGLGLAMLQQRLAQGHRVLSIARGTPPAAAVANPGGATDLSRLAAGDAGTASHPALQCWQADLSDPLPVAARLHDWLAAAGPAGLESVTLINNAGALAALAPLDQSDAADLSTALRVGLEAPLLLSAAFLRATRSWPLVRKLLLISSGLGRRAMASSATYCAAKAGMDHLARALALEEAEKGPCGARVLSLAPGLIDTDMQAQLRAADPARFSSLDQFCHWKTSGDLDSPGQAAIKVLKVLDSPDFGSSDAVADVRDL